MSYPVYIIGGGAGSGKDTVAEMMAQGRQGVLIAQADPMKRFVAKAFGFTEHQLWGPSAARNAPDERFALVKGGKLMYEAVNERLGGGPGNVSGNWIRDLQTYSPVGAKYATIDDIGAWFGKVQDTYLTFDHPGLTPRATLQLLGTEFGRALSPDIWSHYAINVGEKLLLGGYSYDRMKGLYKDETNPGHQFVVITDGRFRNEILNVKKLGGRAIQVYNPDDSKDQAVVDKAGVAGHVSEKELRGIPRSWYDISLRNDKSQGLESLRNRVDALTTALLDGRPVYRDQAL